VVNPGSHCQNIQVEACGGYQKRLLIQTDKTSSLAYGTHHIDTLPIVCCLAGNGNTFSV
jgi:hypothetical protein